jgi:hypothetical protein
MAGFDALVRGPNRLSLFVSARTGIGDYNETTTFSITTFCVGIAYRRTEPAVARPQVR